MNGVHFETRPPVVPSAPNRADIACFVGFVGRRKGVEVSIDSPLFRWLVERGWATPHEGTQRLSYMRTLDQAQDLLNLPVPIDTWEVFDALFAWDEREIVSSRATATTYLGAAVRSFFQQGGRKCYVVRVGDPWPLGTPRSERLPNVAKLIPGYVPTRRASRFAASPADRSSWSGIGHLFGLPDVCFLCMPDLADVVAVDRVELEAIRMPEPKEQFVECSEPERALPPDNVARSFAAPRCDKDGYDEWARAIRLTAEQLLAGHRREVQLVAALPIPHPDSSIGRRGGGGGDEEDEARHVFAEADLLSFMLGKGWLSCRFSLSPATLASAFVQLAYPWVRSPGAVRLPESLESPDAVLVGVLARNALTRGTFLSAADAHLADVFDVSPLLRREQIASRQPDPLLGHADNSLGGESSLLERVSLFGPTPHGMRLLSDVTTSSDESYRPASVNRLVSLIIRMARRIGQDLVFEPSGERVWAELRDRMGDFMLRLLQAGALRGATPAEAYQVRCDRSTMSQSDIDNGRIVAQVIFQAAAPVERITVLLTVEEGGTVGAGQIGVLTGEAA